MVLPKTRGEGKRPLPSPWFWCEKHTVRACGRCLHPAVKASGRCLHHGFGAKTQGEGKRGVPFTMVLVRKTHDEGKRPLRCLHHGLVRTTHGEGKRPLPSPWFWCQKHTVKASGRCLHRGLGAKNTQCFSVPGTLCEGKRPLPSPWLTCQQLCSTTFSKILHPSPN